MLDIIEKLKNHHNGSKAFMVYAYVMILAGERKEVNIRQSDLQKALDFSLPTIRECLRTLEEEELIEAGYGIIKLK